MSINKRTAAFILCLTLAAATVPAPVYTVFAEEETVSDTVEEETALDTDEEEDDDGVLIYGDYTCSLTHDNNISIDGFSGSGDVVIPDNFDGVPVTEIGSYAFKDSEITSVYIPASVTYVFENPFIECPSLKEITVADDNENYFSENGILYCNESNGSISLAAYPSGKTDTEFTVPDDVTAISGAAIYNTNLEKIVLHSGITSLEHHALAENTKLTSVNLEDTSVEELDNMVFAYCTSLVEILFPDTLDYIGAGDFAGCTSLKTVTLPESLTYVGQNAFAGTAMKKIIIPESVTTIGYCAFGYDENLEPVDNFIVIGTSGSTAEDYCTDSDDDYEYSNDFSFIDVSNADIFEEAEDFEYLSSGDYTYVAIDGKAYITACLSADSVIEVPEELDGLPVTRIYTGAFFGIYADEIILPDTITKIDSLAFYSCTYLTSITLPSSLETIGANAFYGCYSLKTIDIPASVTTIGDDALFGCTSLESITVQDGSESFSSSDGILFNKDMTVLVAYPTAKADSTYTVPESVTEISTSAFANNTYLEKVILKSVEKIGDYAFESCTSLNEVRFSKNLKSIGACAFYGCTSLLSVAINDDIEEIGSYALGYCVNPDYDGTESDSDDDDYESYYSSFYDTDEDDEETVSADMIVDGFKIYASKGSGGQQYAEQNGIECVTGTINIAGYNVAKSFIYVIAGIIIAVILAIVGTITGKHIKNKKKSTNRKKTEVKDNEDKTDN
jgi:hypothetical protein